MGVGDAYGIGAGVGGGDGREVEGGTGGPRDIDAILAPLVGRSRETAGGDGERGRATGGDGQGGGLEGDRGGELHREGGCGTENLARGVADTDGVVSGVGGQQRTKGQGRCRGPWDIDSLLAPLVGGSRGSGGDDFQVGGASLDQDLAGGLAEDRGRSSSAKVVGAAGRWGGGCPVGRVVPIEGGGDSLERVPRAVGAWRPRRDVRVGDLVQDDLGNEPDVRVGRGLGRVGPHETNRLQEVVQLP